MIHLGSQQTEDRTEVKVAAVSLSVHRSTLQIISDSLHLVMLSPAFPSAPVEKRQTKQTDRGKQKNKQAAFLTDAGISFSEQVLQP